jgi:hypothetical protein
VTQLIQFEGQTHQFPDDFTPVDIQRALSSVPRASSQSALPPLPPGFRLDQPPQAAVPPLPPGFTLERPSGIPPLPPGYTLDQTPKLVPVDHDPFAPPKLVPVDHDPFAAAPIAQQQDSLRLIGTTPATATAPARVTMDTSGRPPGAMHSLAVGAQGVGKGLTDIVTGPFDLVAGAQNLATAGINKIFGTNIPMATPASKMVEHVTEPFTIPESEMSPGEKLGYNINRFGTQALGTGAALATRAPAVAAAIKPADTRTGRVLDTLARPYAAAPARTLTGDAIGGMGAGAAVNAVDDYVPDNAVTGGTATKQVANLIAPLVGGMGANTVQHAVEGIAGVVRNMATRAFGATPREVPLNPNTHAPYSDSAIEKAANRMQAAASAPPRALAQDIRENAAELSAPKNPGEVPVDASALPTSGLLSRDPGLVTLEQGSRIKNSPAFITRDQNVKGAAAERVESLRDEGADLGSVVRRAAAAREERIAPMEQHERAIEDFGGRVDQQRLNIGAEYAPIARSEAGGNASRRLDQALVDQTYVPARAEKNRQFDTASGRNEQLPADDVFAAIDRVRAGANGLAPGILPNDFMARIDWLRPRIDPDSGENVGGPGTASGANLADLRKFVGAAQARAQESGNFDLADNIGALRSAINRTIEQAPGYADANANYHQFADRFRPERNDEMARFTRELDRNGQQPDGALNRGATPPTKTADRFLRSPESAATVPRALEGSPAAAAGNAAVREYYRSDFATSVLNGDGTINPIRARRWADMNSDVLRQFPTIRSEFDNIIATARRGEQMSAEVRAALDQARAARGATEADIDRSVIGTLLREDPRDVAAKILNGGYRSEARFDEIRALVRNDETAKRGWKAAVSEVVADKVQGTRQVGERPEVQFARLAKEFKDNETLLAKTFSPEEMNNLRQAHKLLEYFKEAEKRSTVGSDTAEKIQIPGGFQLAARHLYGDLKGGGVIKRFKLLLELLPSNKQDVDEIVHIAWFDPNVAAYLLERPIKDGNVPKYNINLRRLIAADNAARKSGPGDEDLR